MASPRSPRATEPRSLRRLDPVANFLERLFCRRTKLAPECKGSGGVAALFEEVSTELRIADLGGVCFEHCARIADRFASRVEFACREQCSRDDQPHVRLAIVDGSECQQLFHR